MEVTQIDKIIRRDLIHAYGEGMINLHIVLILISFFLLRTMRKLVSLGDYFGTWKL